MVDVTSDIRATQYFQSFALRQQGQTQTWAETTHRDEVSTEKKRPQTLTSSVFLWKGQATLHSNTTTRRQSVTINSHRFNLSV